MVSPTVLTRGFWLALASLLLCLGACVPVPPPIPLPTERPSPSPSASPTVIWFPPSETPTPLSTIAVTPTPEQRPDIGEILLADDFSTADDWSLSVTNRGQIALGINELTIAIVEPKTLLYSVRSQPVFTDFYAEITASPNLCSGVDEYGLLLRYASPADFYRFSLSCDGQIRLDRLYGGIASSPQPWLSSANVPNGAPSSSRLGVWALGNEMHFFVNDEFQFSVSDRIHPSGFLGVFARSTGENAVTVSFSDLVVHQLQP
jgi:hypothetical protein